MHYQRLTYNLVGAKWRYDTLEGKQYMVIPTVALTVGVHNGSEGPLFYPPEQLSKNPVTWNIKPIVVYHPVLNGEGVSACEPSVLERQRVGMMMNTAYDGRLRTESWIDENKADLIDKRIVENIKAGRTMEVSTGLFHDMVQKEGEWNGEKYTGIVTNIQPDHLAILPDQVGACSIADGAGMLRNSDGEELSYDDIRGQLRCLIKDCGSGNPVGSMSEYSYVSDIYPKYAIYEQGDKCYKIGYKVRKGKVSIDGEPEEVRKQTNYVTANEDTQGPLRMPKPAVSDLSDVMKHQQMQKALEAHYAGVQQEGDWGGWVTDLYANYVVWSKDGKQFRLPYTYDDDKIRFDGEPEEVERTSEYRTRRLTPIDGTSSPYNVNRETTMPTARQPAQNTIHKGAHELFHEPSQHDAHHPAEHGASDSQTRTDAGGARKEEVNKMITGGHAKEEDRTYLEGLPDDHFESVKKFATRGATEPIQSYSYEGIGDRSNVHASHNQARVITVNQYIDQAPPEVREMLRSGIAQLNAKRTQLVTNISANPNNRFTKEYLATLPIEQLEGMAALAAPPVQQQPVNNYGGQGSIPMFMHDLLPTQNQEASGEVPVLAIPSMTFNDEEGRFAKLRDKPKAVSA